MTDKGGVNKKTIYLDTADETAIAELRKRYGLSTDSDAVRMALRVMAASPTLQVDVPPPLRRKRVVRGSDGDE